MSEASSQRRENEKDLHAEAMDDAARAVRMTDAVLDAAVAERVMGTDYLARNGQAVHLVSRSRMELWSPTTDANAMMEVVELMAELGYRASMAQLTREPRWVAQFEDAVTEEVCGDSTPQLTLGRAVCIAALRAADYQAKR